MMGDLLRQYCLPVLVSSELTRSAKPLHEHDTMPPGVHESSVYGVRSTKLVAQRQELDQRGDGVAGGLYEAAGDVNGVPGAEARR